MRRAFPRAAVPFHILDRFAPFFLDIWFPAPVSDLASIGIMGAKDLLVDLFHIIGQANSIDRAGATVRQLRIRTKAGSMLLACPIM